MNSPRREQGRGAEERQTERNRKGARERRRQKLPGRDEEGRQAKSERGGREDGKKG